MTLADQIRDLADRVQRDLRTARDYYEHTKASWHATREFTHAGQAANIRETETGALLSADELDKLAQRYVSVHLAESVFKDIASLLEDWVFGLLEVWLLAYPKGIPNKDKKPVPLADLLEASDLDTVLRDVVSRELISISYKRPVEWFAYLRDRVDLGCPTADQIKDLAEIKASRDVLIHNRGIANQAYLTKTGDRARFTDGDRLDVPGFSNSYPIRMATSPASGTATMTSTSSTSSWRWSSRTSPRRPGMRSAGSAWMASRLGVWLQNWV